MTETRDDGNPTSAGEAGARSMTGGMIQGPDERDKEHSPVSDVPRVRSTTDGTTPAPERSLEEQLLLIDEEICGDDAGVPSGLERVAELLKRHWEEPYIESRYTVPPRYMTPRQEEQWVRDHYTPLRDRPLTRPARPDLSVPESLPPGEMVYNTHGEYAFDQFMKAGCGCLGFLIVMFVIVLLIEIVL